MEDLEDLVAWAAFLFVGQPLLWAEEQRWTEWRGIALASRCGSLLAFAILALKPELSPLHCAAGLTCAWGLKTASWLRNASSLGSYLPLFLEVHISECLLYVSAGFSCSLLGLLSQSTKKTLGQRLLGILPSENSSKRTEDQDNPREVFKMLIDLVGIFVVFLLVVKLIFLLPINSTLPLYTCLLCLFPRPFSRVTMLISLNSQHALPTPCSSCANLKLYLWKRGLPVINSRHLSSALKSVVHDKTFSLLRKF